MEKNDINFHPIISSIQKIALYETKSHFYLVGSNNLQTRFSVLKIDRTEPRELIIHDDKVEWTQQEIQDLINMIDSGNRHCLTNVTSAFGIVGFIRFLEGYYIILVTRRTRVAVIGHHTIYKIEHTSMVYIPHDSVRLLHPDEPRYLKMFQAIDLSSNFYFSYSYDLTHTLQHNLSCPKRIIPNILDDSLFLEENEPLKIYPQESKSKLDFAVRPKPNRKFVWNSHLLSKVEKVLHSDWLLYITHGFIGQSNMSVFGRSIYVTLLARRSSKYAGTRFLKRGANFQGDVANEVETEQMVHDSGVSSLNQSYFTSFVQMRGSIPGHWKQDMGKMVAKPTITLDLNDPYAETAGAHFNELLKRFGAPIVVLNLVKKREKKKQEQLLSDEFNVALKYLNQFLPPEFQIQYKTFDMARKNKSNSNVMGSLAGIARSAISKTGFFHNQTHYYAQKPQTIVGQTNTNLMSRKYGSKNVPKVATRGSLQTGIIRTNCVDCLDRTNTAQFAIGKCVLGYQLCALGILDSPNLEFDTDCVRMLESLYEDHGDTLALQYGGSQLVHRIKTYRKTAPWTSQGNDIMQTLSRYYSNTFSDAEKQNTINLFLGLFVPDENRPQIWDYTSDYYFHFKPLNRGNLLTQWWDQDVFKSLPYSYNDATKACSEIIQVQSKEIEMIDAYSDYHRPYQLSVLNELFAYKICNSIRDFMPNYTNNYSPFTIRIRPGRRREETTNKYATKNPSLTGQSSTSSTTSGTSTDSSDCSDTTDDETSLNTNDSISQTKDIQNELITFEGLFPSMGQVYGTEIRNPKEADLLLYKRYVITGRKATKPSAITSRKVGLKQWKTQPITGSSMEVDPPKVSPVSRSIYEMYINTPICGGYQPNPKDTDIYNNYVNFKM